MLTVLARFQVKAGQAARFQELCADLIAATRQEKGCVSYELFQDKADGNKFSFIEFWHLHTSPASCRSWSISATK